ncbi:hypothetical protein [Chitinophaga flava]|uniref:Knr4/Smi1-like domain-containing protein n=1 Tax=Chitinophaga flava TaxID=2259036 RepID=A0A365XXE6_9BACT|nr:hypothetical protein [Chitinophaga flava]RBL90681.1 hypothetical protein DF182_29990 [Chitinophaga flava]
MMNELKPIIDKMKMNWSVAARAIHFGKVCPFPLKCTFAVPVEEQINSFPDELNRFWQIAARADLFIDETYGQWGMVILPPKDTRNLTLKQQQLRDEISVNDIVFGHFYGDDDLLLMDASGAVYICLPLDARSDWPRAADSLCEFLIKLEHAQGAKYWARP